MKSFRKVTLMIVWLVGISFIGCAGQKSIVMPEVVNNQIPSEVLDLPKKTPVELAEESVYIPKHALMESASQVSWLHPREIEKMGVEKITILKYVLNFGLLTIEDIMGEWPVLASAGKNEEIKGYSYFFALNAASGDFWAEAIFLCSKEELEKSKILPSNKDGGFFYNLLGEERICDVKQFDKDLEYRDNFFNEFGDNLSEYVEEIIVGSDRWKDFVDLTDRTVRAGRLFIYMVEGQARVSPLPEHEYRLACSKISDWDTSKRALKSAGRIPLTLASFTGYGTVIGAASNLVTGAMDDRRTGLFLRGNGFKHQVVPTSLRLYGMLKRAVVEGKNYTVFSRNN